MGPRRIIIFHPCFWIPRRRAILVVCRVSAGNKWGQITQLPDPCHAVERVWGNTCKNTTGGRGPIMIVTIRYEDHHSASLALRFIIWQVGLRFSNNHKKHSQEIFNRQYCSLPNISKNLSLSKRVMVIPHAIRDCLSMRPISPTVEEKLGPLSLPPNRGCNGDDTALFWWGFCESTNVLPNFL